MTLDRRSFLKLVGAGAGAVGAVGLPMIGFTPRSRACFQKSKAPKVLP